MAAVAPSSDKAAELMQNLTLESEPKTVGVPEPGKKNGPVFSNGAAKGMGKPFNPNSCFVPNGYPSAYYYGGYDGQGDWNVYSRYMNVDGGMAQGVYGDNCSYMYHQGYGYTPYGTYAPPNSSSPIIQQDGQHYGLQQYQHSKHGAKVGLSSSVVPGKDFTSQRNQRLRQPLPQFANLNGSRHPSGLELFPGFMNGMYPSNRMYGQYGNTFRANPRYGSAAYGHRTGSVGDGYGLNHFKRNVDGFSELNKGPRASKISDNKNTKSRGPVTLLLKGQNLPVKSDDEEVPLVPNQEQYNGKDFSENYSDAKFFIIKSYSEDDIHKSIKYSVWASTPNGNKKLDAAYQEAKEKPGGCPIFLLFSVNTSGQFVGLAEMLGPVDFGKTVDYWQQDRWTGCFSVKWHVIKDIPNSALRHITLENNENKPVTNSRDTQEVKFEMGVQIVKIFKEHSSETCILDDFGFYEAREQATREKKSKEQQFSKEASKPVDVTFGTVTLPKSLDATLMNESATANAAEGRMKAEGLLEGKGSTTAHEDSSKSR